MKLFLSINHKRIALYYWLFALVAGVVGGMLSLALRLGQNGVDIQAFSTFATLSQYGQDGNAMVSLLSSTHALLMIFFMLIPALFGGFATYFVPIMIGSDETSFPRLNWLALLLLCASFSLLIFCFIFPPSPPIFAFLLLLLIHLVIVSALILSLNLCVTIITRRALGMKFAQMPSFVWSILVASLMMIATLPVLAATFTLLITQAIWGIGSFTLTTPPRLQMMMWFLSHPELYVLLLPAFGIVSQIIATFAKRPLFSPQMLHGAMIAIGAFGFILWSQSLFSMGESAVNWPRYFLLYLPLIGLPVAGIIVSWLVTLGRGGCCLQVPMLWAMGFIFMLGAGSLSALGLSAITQPDMDAISSHFHYILALGGVFAIFCGWYFWFPKITGYSLRATSGKWHFWLMFVGSHLIFLPPYFSGFMHESHSFFTLVATKIGWHNISNIGVILAALSLLIFLYSIVEAFIRKSHSTANPWGEGANTLEWYLPSPIQGEQWQEVPLLFPQAFSPAKEQNHDSHQPTN